MRCVGSDGYSHSDLLRFLGITGPSAPFARITVVAPRRDDPLCGVASEREIYSGLAAVACFAIAVAIMVISVLMS